MPAGKNSARPIRTLVFLFIIVAAVFGSVIAGSVFSDAKAVPGFALDLEGGTQLVLTPNATNGQKISSDDVNQAVEIIRQRVDASGVSEAEIAPQAGGNIVVGVPGKIDQETRDLIQQSAHMAFRPVLTVAYNQAVDREQWLTRAYPPPEKKTGDAQKDGASPKPSPSASAATKDKAKGKGMSEKEYGKIVDAAMDPKQATDELKEKFDNYDCEAAKQTGAAGESDPKKPSIACDTAGQYKYVLGPVLLDGAQIASASSGMGSDSQGRTTGEWVVNLAFKGNAASSDYSNSAGARYRVISEKLVSKTQPNNQFAAVLDGEVITAPTQNAAIPDGRSQISGQFTQSSAKTLADQLSFGSLPIDFTIQSQQEISATLGSEQLQKGLIAGFIGLLLVGVYSLLQYRLLGTVTIVSLILGTGLTYGLILLLSWLQGYRLSLAGVAGIIVSIGITADSFIVYFERIRDELRDGRPLGRAVDLGWQRARRTILASDAVNFLAAAVLYLVSVGGVRGFAFTLGLTTIMDLIVVFLFTHPLMLLLSRTKFFKDGHPSSGLDPYRLGAPGSVHYAGRLRVSRVPDRASAASTEPADQQVSGTQAVAAAIAAKVEEHAEEVSVGHKRTARGIEVGERVPDGPLPGMSIAERKAAQAAAASESTGESTKDSSKEDDASGDDSTPNEGGRA